MRAAAPPTPHACQPPRPHTRPFPAAPQSLLAIFGPGGEHLHTLSAAAGGPLHQVAWLDDHRVLACCGSEATVWHVEQERADAVAAFGTNPAAAIVTLAAAPSGRYLAAACDNRTVRAREGWACVL
jgi:hypothetical protein